MKILISDEESGSLIQHDFLKGTDTSKVSSTKVTSTTYASEGKTRYVQRMAKVPDSQLVVTARSDGSVQVYDISSEYKCTKQWPAGTTCQLKDDRIVALSVLSTNEKVLVTSQTGRITKLDLSEKEEKAEVWNVKGPLETLAVHPKYESTFIVAGQERESEVFEFQDEVESESETQVIKKVKSMWQARNVKENKLHLRVPVWIKHVQFHADSHLDHYQFSVVTKSGKLRKYNSKEGRRPRQEFDVASNSLSTVYMGSSKLAVSDVKTSTVLFDLENNKVQGNLKGFNGSVSAITATPDETLIALGGLDRYLKVYESSTRKIVGNVFTNGLISQVLILDSEDEPESLSKRVREDEDEEEDADELWKKLKTVS